MHQSIHEMLKIVCNVMIVYIITIFVQFNQFVDYYQKMSYKYKILKEQH